MAKEHRQKILIVEDVELNRSILVDMLEAKYDIIEAENGVQAVAVLQKYGVEISLVLLDIVMPEMDGFGVLNVMNKNNWIKDIPVIMITSETSSEMMERAYDLGVVDFLNRGCAPSVVLHRVANTLLLYTKQKHLVNLVADQIYEKEQNSNLMVDILSHIVEFRNGESGLHVVHVRTLTDLLLKRLVQKTDRYQLSRRDITLIGMASALHDIGKIAIPEEVLNKPGRLTDEEFAVMKTHSMVGAQMLDDLPFHKDAALVKTAYAICRWHHERYDGRGYPDGLKGDDIPISAQIVAMADVYDALTSKRVYKPAFSYEKALQMILDGQCGAFNPLLLECLQDISDSLQEELRQSASQNRQQEVSSIVQEMQRHEELTASERTLQLLERERMKYAFFAALTEEIQFEYTLNPPMVSLSSQGASWMGMDEIQMDPLGNVASYSQLDQENIRALSEIIQASKPGDHIVQYECRLRLRGEERWCRITARALWSSDEPPCYTGVIGKAVDIHDDLMEKANLEQKASRDALTGLLNHAYAKQRIRQRLAERGRGKYALVMMDLDHFKSANDTYGHMFGDQVLKRVAEMLLHSTRSDDVVARIGGDEFLIFLEYKSGLSTIIERIYASFSGEYYEEFAISISMGVASTAAVGTDYDSLFRAADQALYSAKRDGRGRFRFYESSMESPLTMVSSIDGDTEAHEASKEGGDRQ